MTEMQKIHKSNLRSSAVNTKLKLTKEKIEIPENRTIDVGVAPVLLYDKKFFDDDE